MDLLTGLDLMIPLESSLQWIQRKAGEVTAVAKITGITVVVVFALVSFIRNRGSFVSTLMVIVVGTVFLIWLNNTGLLTGFFTAELK